MITALLFGSTMLAREAEIISRRPRRNHSPDFMVKAVPEAVRGEQPLTELSQTYNVHVTQIAQWKAELLQGASTVFSAAKAAESSVDLKVLHGNIGWLTLENDFVESAFIKVGVLSARQ